MSKNVKEHILSLTSFKILLNRIMKENNVNLDNNTDILLPRHYIMELRLLTNDNAYRKLINHLYSHENGLMNMPIKSFKNIIHRMVFEEFYLNVLYIEKYQDILKKYNICSDINNSMLIWIYEEYSTYDYIFISSSLLSMLGNIEKKNYIKCLSGLQAVEANLINSTVML